MRLTLWEEQKFQIRLLLVREVWISRDRCLMPGLA